MSQTTQEQMTPTPEQALEALDSLDDYARMDTGVDAIGPREVLQKFIAAHLSTPPTKEGQGQAGDTEHVEAICEAYESGYGHGLQGDGLDGSRTPFADPAQTAAYQYGYECGDEKRKKAPPSPVPAEPYVVPMPEPDGCGYVVKVKGNTLSDSPYAYSIGYDVVTIEKCKSYADSRVSEAADRKSVV